MPACRRGPRRKFPRRTPRKAHRRQSLRLGRTRSTTRTSVRHRVDRAQPGPAQKDAGRTPAAALQETMESGAALRLDAQRPQTRYPMGISHRELPRLRPPRLPPHAPQTFMRLVLVLRKFHRTIDPYTLQIAAPKGRETV